MFEKSCEALPKTFVLKPLAGVAPSWRVQPLTTGEL
jgi:hypothetical protein